MYIRYHRYSSGLVQLEGATLQYVPNEGEKRCCQYQADAGQVPDRGVLDFLSLRFDLQLIENHERREQGARHAEKRWSSCIVDAVAHVSHYCVAAS